MSTRMMLLLIAQTILFASILLAFFRMSDAQAGFNDSDRNQALCERLARDIEEMREMNLVAQEQELGTEFENSALVKLARDCGMTERHVRRIRRLDPANLADSDYQSQEIVVELRQVTVEQTLRFCLAVESLPGSPKGTVLNLSAANSQRTGRSRLPTQQEIWNAELTLTQLVFVATKQSR